MYCIDIYTNEEPNWIKVSLKEKNHPSYGTYWQVKVTRREKKKIIRKLEHKKIKYRCYEERWERSSDYRKDFFRMTKPPYRCRYCHRKLKPNKMEVDHIVPVGKVKNSTSARMLLYIQGISDVNNIRNLAPSCYKCNGKKGAKLGFWWIKGILGKYKLYWIFRKLILIAIIASILYFATDGFNNFEIINNISQYLQNLFFKIKS